MGSNLSGERQRERERVAQLLLTVSAGRVCLPLFSQPTTNERGKTSKRGNVLQTFNQVSVNQGGRREKSTRGKVLGWQGIEF